MIRYFEVPGASADQIRLGDQYEDRQVAWHRYSADTARARRRCGRMSFFAAVHLVRKWHKCDLRGRADQCPQLGVERTQRGGRLWAVHDPERSLGLSPDLRSSNGFWSSQTDQ